MPMREYLCQPCHRVYTFMTATVDDARRPVCPRCGDTHLEKQMSSFARVQRRKEPLAAIPKRPGEPDCTWADISKIQRELKWKPEISFEEGVRTLLAGIDYWKDAPLWDEGSIAEATKTWFEYLK